MLQLYILNLAGDMKELGYLARQNSDIDAIDPAFNYSEDTHRCTVGIRVSSDFSNLFVGHTTWGSFYSGFLRMVKTLNYNFKGLKTSK